MLNIASIILGVISAFLIPLEKYTHIPTPAAVAVYCFALLMMVVAGISSGFLYRDVVNLLDDDPERYINEHIRILSRVSGRHKAVVCVNLLTGCLAYEMYGLAEFIALDMNDFMLRSHRVNPYIRFRFLEIRLAIELHQKHREYQTQVFLLRGAISGLQETIHKKHPKYDELVQRSYDLHSACARLMESDLKNPTDSDKELLSSIRQQLESYTPPVKKGITIQYGELSRKYLLGMVLLCLGEVGRADALFEEIAASDTAYPLVKRARAYLSSHDSGTILSRRFL